MPAKPSPFDLNALNPGARVWSPEALERLQLAVATLRQSWEEANAVLVALVNAALRKRRAGVSLPANAPPPGLIFEETCSRLARATQLVEEFAPAQPGWGWLVAGRTLFNPDRPDLLDSLLRLVDPERSDSRDKYLPRIALDADFWRREIVGPYLEHADIVRAALDEIEECRRSLADPAGTGAKSPQRADGSLNDTERRILTYCRRSAHKGERIAQHIKLSYDYTRRLLARLIKKRRLRKTNNGYRTV
jgi:hypothetical protein